jgi:hypothetical protein
VDAYVAIEQNRLRYLCLNQKKLRADLYQGLQDAITTCNNNVVAIGQRIILPSSLQKVHITWFRIIKMPLQSTDGPAAQMPLLHSLAIPNGLISREHCYPDNNLRINQIW